jgi:hypothetical protein
MASFENALVMSVVSFFEGSQGQKTRPQPSACRPCNMLKGRHIFPDLRRPNLYARRDELRNPEFERLSHGSAAKA